MKRAIIIVLDSVGMGELPDAAAYGDVGSNTLGNIAKAIEGFTLPNLQEVGLGNIDGMEGYLPASSPTGAFARMAEISKGKDTTTGHWEMAGVVSRSPFPTYPEGFPEDLIKSFEQAINRKSLGNVVASGTEILDRLGEDHLNTGFPIVYTSADSVFQIAAHEEVIPLEDLYNMCKKARVLLTGEHAVGRVIARPFIGNPGAFKRTGNRRDFSLDPTGTTILDAVKRVGQEVRAVGKIEDIFNHRGITHAIHTSGNMDGVDQTIRWMKESFTGLLFTNLVDFDMVYGHRNNVQGYADALKAFDARMPEILAHMGEEDILFITADHGCDPTTESTDHSREYVPLLVVGNPVKPGANLGTRSTFADMAQTIAEWLDAGTLNEGTSFLSDCIGG